MTHSPLRRLLPAAVALALAAAPGQAQNCANTSVGFTTLDDLGPGTYLGFEGGLYPGGANVRPLAHEVAGLAEAALVVPRDAAGAVDLAAGKLGFISIGMSICVIHFNALMQAAASDVSKHPRVVLANCAQGGQTAADISNPSAPYWTNWVPSKLAQAGLAAGQVQVVWFLEADSAPTAGFPQYALTLQSEFTAIMGILRANFPNARLLYGASRIYAGYATTPLNPEPYAYQQSFAVKWLIEDQIGGNPALNFSPAAGPVVAPWIAWGPYMWADGLVPRSDGLVWVCSDFNPDGTHPSAQGAAKHATHLLSFLHGDSTARSWYLAQPAPVAFGTGKVTSQGGVPAIGWSGTASVAANQFQVAVSGGVPGKPSLALWSARPALVPFAGATLYVGPPLHRFAPRLLDATGAASYPFPLPPGLRGETRDFQVWFRDPLHPDGTGVGLSNGLQVRFY
jgi:hypothetical protein